MMRMFRQLFTNIRFLECNTLKINSSFKTNRNKQIIIEPLSSFLKVPYDEQYEPRDFIRNKRIIK